MIEKVVLTDLLMSLDNSLWWPTSNTAANDPFWFPYPFVLSPHTEPGMVCVVNRYRSGNMGLWRLSHGGQVLWPLPWSLRLLTLVKLYPKATQVALQKVPCGEEQRPFTKSQYQLISNMNEPNWKWILQAPSNQIAIVLADIRMQSHKPELCTRTATGHLTHLYCKT